MTEATAHFGKKLSNFRASPKTAEYLDALSGLTGLAPWNSGSKVGGLLHNHRTSALVVVVPGNRHVEDRGTWAHPKLAIFFARWLDVRFAVWCDAMIEDQLHDHLRHRPPVHVQPRDCWPDRQGTQAHPC